MKALHFSHSDSPGEVWRGLLIDCIVHKESLAQTNIKYLRYVDDPSQLRDFYRSADVKLVPSRMEYSGPKALEPNMCYSCCSF